MASEKKPTQPTICASAEQPSVSKHHRFLLLKSLSRFRTKKMKNFCQWTKAGKGGLQKIRTYKSGKPKPVNAMNL